uniref:ARAD1D01518p n=1 Tax=Blastobotrys adeninivorans TaxID=409370 RepID=A0A060TDM8_BLAAD
MMSTSSGLISPARFAFHKPIIVYNLVMVQVGFCVAICRADEPHTMGLKPIPGMEETINRRRCRAAYDLRAAIAGARKIASMQVHGRKVVYAKAMIRKLCSNWSYSFIDVRPLFPEPNIAVAQTWLRPSCTVCTADNRKQG